MTIWQRIAREPNAIAGIVVAAYGLLVAFDILVLTAPQYGAVGVFGGAAVFLLRWLVTPTGEVAAQLVPGKTDPVAGEASPLPTGTPVEIATQDQGY